MATFRPDQENSVYIGEGAELSGALRAHDAVVIDGAFEGEIVCNQLILGQNGSVKGKVDATSADIAGYLQADIVVKQLLAVRATGRVEGSWDCGALEVARGALLQGSASVTETAKTPTREAPIPRLAPPEPEEEEEDEYEQTETPPPRVAGPRRLTKLTLRPTRRSAG